MGADKMRNIEAGQDAPSPWSMVQGGAAKRICPVCEGDCTGMSDAGFENHRFECLKADISPPGLSHDSQTPLKQLDLWPTLPPLSLPVPGENERLEPHEVAQAVLKSWNLVAIADTEEVLIYKNGVYAFGAEQLLAQAIEKFYTEAGRGELIKTHFWNELLGHIQRVSYTDRKQFDADPYILNLQNGLLDVRDCTLKPHTPKYLSVGQLPLSFDVSAKCPRFRQFLGEVLYPGDEQPLQEYSGSIVWKGYEHQTGLLLDGAGSNGKDTFLSCLKAVVGAANTSARSLHDLEENTFATADLFGKLLNYHSDLSDAELRSVSKFKMLTGGSPVSAEHKFVGAFTFVNFAKLVFACNTIPKSNEDTVAFFRRWMLITFPNTFIGANDNRNLLNELTTPEELSGILNWMLEGLARLRANGWKFSYNKSAEIVREEYIRKSSPIQAFLMDCCEAESQIETPKKALYAGFLTYGKKQKLPLVSYPTFCRNLPMWAKVEDSYPERDGKRVHCFRGLFVKPEDKWGVKEKDEDEDDPAKDKAKEQPESQEKL
jgi:putative DNA primase/helicase